MTTALHAVIPCADLKSALTGLARVIQRRNALPILGGVKIAVELDTLTLMGTNLDEVLTYRLASSRIVQTGKPVVVELEKLRSVTEGAGASDITLLSDGPVLRVSRMVAGVEIRSELAILDADEWPALPASIIAEPVEGDFLAQLRRVARFVSRDTNRGPIVGVSIERGERGHYLVATDGRRLTAVNSVMLPEMESCVVHPSRFLLSGKFEGECRVGLGHHLDHPWFHVRVGAWSYMCRALEETFPNWRQVVPSARGGHVLEIGTANADRVKHLLGTMPSESPNNTVVLVGTDAGVRLAAPSAIGKSDGGVLLPDTRCVGGNVTVGVNRDYLLDALEAGFHSFRCTAPHEALYAEDGQGGVHVLMPVVLKEPAESTQDPTPKKEKEMKQESSTNAPASSTDKLLAAYEAARTKLREANDALASVAVAIKEALREDKQRRAEIESVRSGLAKLKAIQV